MAKKKASQASSGKKSPDEPAAKKKARKKASRKAAPSARKVAKKTARKATPKTARPPAIAKQSVPAPADHEATNQTRLEFLHEDPAQGDLFQLDPLRSASAALRSEISRHFPRDFLWGTATAATQIDGGDPASDWAHFSRQRGKIADGSSCETACDHWQRYEQDFVLMESLGLNAYRLGVDWSRFQPEAGAPFDTAALDHLRGMLGSLKAKGIRPLLTLHHFAVPQWWLERGGFVREENLGEFLNFARFLIEGVADLVQDYITFNEPNIYSFMAYVMGDWPPARSGMRGYQESMRVQRSMVLAHFTLYDFIHETHARRNLPKPAVSIAKHMRVMDPRRPDSVLDRDRARAADQRFNRLVPDCLHTGRLLAPLGRGEQIHDPGAWDFFGLNYYTRDFVRFAVTKPHQLFIDVAGQTASGKKLPGADAARSARNDLGWEIYPEGLERVLLELHDRYAGLPIRITENGTADAADAFRQRYIHDHLTAVRRAMTAGVPVAGYYHWSFLDNFEWSDGYVPRFGLVAVDYATQERRPRPSAAYYGRLARTGRIPTIVPEA